MKPQFFKEINKKTLKCSLCPHNCEIQDGHMGFCGVRGNRKNVPILTSSPVPKGGISENITQEELELEIKYDQVGSQGIKTIIPKQKPQL